MRQIGFVMAVGALLAGTSAYAQSARITSVDTSAGSSISPAPSCSEAPCFNVPAQVGDGAGAKAFPNDSFDTRANGNAQWNSFVDTTTDPTKITFESANSIGGQPIGANSYSQVQIGIENGGGLNLHSTITPAAMGLYVANAGDGSCILSGTCAQVDPGSAYDFAAFAAAPGGNLYAVAGFDFSVTTSATGFDDRVLYSVSGYVQINADGRLFVSESTADGFLKLHDFGLQTPPAGGAIPYHSLGYNWGTTEFDATGADFDSSGALFDTAFQTVTYRTSVYTSVDASCLSGGTGVDNGVTACLVAYSGFGDPIGRGVSAASFGDFGIFNHSDEDGIEGVNFSSFTIDAPRIQGNNLVVGGTVPEPAAWAMMIVGFASVGGVLRRRRGLAHA